MSTAVESLRETLRTLQASNAPEQAAHRTAVAVPPAVTDGFPSRLAAKLSPTDLPATPSCHQALMIAVHSLLVDCGLTCIGASDAADGTGFARPIRATATFLPKDWSTQGGSVFQLWYSYPPPGTTSSLRTVLLSGMTVASLLSLSVRVRDGGQAAGGGSAPAQTSASVELDTATYCTQGSAASGGVSSLLSPLLSEDLLSSLRSIIRTQLVYPLVPQLNPAYAADKGSRQRPEQDRAAGMPSYEGRGEQGSQGGGGLAAGLRQPRTGLPGDFDRDLMPDMSGSIPGGLLGAGRGGRGGMGPGGMTVGPEHPLFGHPGGMGGGIGGGMPFGAPPGARFDPFGPPGTGIGIPGGPRGPGIGGPRGPPGFGPAPDHLRPPGGHNDMGPPPDIYW